MTDIDAAPSPQNGQALELANGGGVWLGSNEPRDRAVQPVKPKLLEGSTT